MCIEIDKQMRTHVSEDEIKVLVSGGRGGTQPASKCILSLLFRRCHDVFSTSAQPLMNLYEKKEVKGRVVQGILYNNLK